MASREAVERRRANRRAATAAKQHRDIDRRHRVGYVPPTASDDDRSYLEKFVNRMIARFRIPDNMVTFMHRDARYWHARGCGWDALAKEFSRDGHGEICDPHQSETWRWWVCLAYETRLKLRREFRLARR